MLQATTKDKISLAFCLLGQFLNCIAISIPSPFLPREVELHGLGSLTTGVMLGVVPFLQCFFNFMWNKIAITIGMRNVLKAGTMITGVMTTLFAFIQFIPYDSTLLFAVAGFGVRLLLAVGTSAVFTATLALATTIFPEQSVWVLSLIGAIGGVGMVCGPAVGSGLFMAGGFWLVFVACGGAIILVSIATCIWFPKQNNVAECLPVDVAADVKAGIKADVKADVAAGGPADVTCEPSTSKLPVPYKRIVLDLRTLVGLSVGLFSSSCWVSIDPILEPELRNGYNLTEDRTALVFLLVSGLFIISAPIAGKLVGKSYCLDSLLLILIGLSISTTSFLFIGPCPLFGIHKLQLWTILVCLSVLGLTNCLLFVPAQNLVFNIERLNLPDSVDKTLVRGFLSACWNTAYAFGTGLGMIYSGAVAKYTGWAWTMTSYAGGCVLLILIVLIVKTRELILLRKTSYIMNTQM